MFGIDDERVKQFQIYFNVPLHRFWHPILGFDIVKFNDWLSVPDNISIRDYLTDKYSKEVSDFIAELVRINTMDSLAKGEK